MSHADTTFPPLKSALLRNMIDGWVRNPANAYLFLYHYCVLRFHHYRLPGFEDPAFCRAVNGLTSRVALSVGAPVPPNLFAGSALDLDQAYRELDALRGFMQPTMLRVFAAPRVTLLRRVTGTYAARLWAAREQARKEGAGTVTFDTHSLMSFSGQSLGQYDAALPITSITDYSHWELGFTVDVPVTDILYCSSVIGHEPGTANPAAGECREYIVYNPSPRGEIEIPIGNFYLHRESCDPAPDFAPHLPIRALWTTPDLAHRHKDFRAAVRALDQSVSWFHRKAVRTALRKVEKLHPYGLC